MFAATVQACLSNTTCYVSLEIDNRAFRFSINIDNNVYMRATDMHCQQFPSAVMTDFLNRLTGYCPSGFVQTVLRFLE